MMSYVSFANRLGLMVMPFQNFPFEFVVTSSPSNAVGESCTFIGKLNLGSGPGTSKTISSAGGKIYFGVASGGLTWATAGTTLRVGIQDVSPSTGIEDGVFDVYKDLVQGTDVLTQGTTKEVLLSNGSKTITHGDMIAISIEMTVRNGTDSINVTKSSNKMNYPYCTLDTAAAPVKTSDAPHVMLVFDDGTVGYIEEFQLPFIMASQAFQSSSVPDEYGIIFQLPFKCKINALCVRINDVDPGDDGALVLVSNPLTTPVDIVTVVVDSIYSANPGTAIGLSIHPIAETELLANTDYAVTYRATTNTARNITMYTIAHADIRKAMLLGTNLRGATRTDAGAFSTSTTVFADIGFRISQLDDGASGGSAVESSVAFVGG